MKKVIFPIAAVALTSCATNQQKMETAEINPLFISANNKFNSPNFEKISLENFKPAYETGIAEHIKEIDAIANNTAQPSFENTVLAFEKAGERLGHVSTVFGNLNGAATNDAMQALAREMSPVLSKHYNNIYLNAQLFNRIQTVWNSRNQLNLPTDDYKLLDDLYKSFVRSGAKLTAEEKEKVKAINTELSALTLKFGQNALAENNGYELVVSDKNKLKGLPNDLLQSASDLAKKKGKEGSYIFTLAYSNVVPFLQYCEDRALRKDLWTAYVNRGNNQNTNDNNEIAIKMANLRLEKAKILGYENHSQYVLEESMAKTPQKVTQFLEDLWKPTLVKAKQEESEIKAMMQKDGISGDVQPYDWRFYSEKLKKAKFNLDEQELKPYFSLDNVTKGIFMVCKNLYGLQFERKNDIPTYHPEATAWEVKEKDGTTIGLLFMDFFPRESKRGGAWMTSYKPQGMLNGKRTYPVISIVCNFSKPTAEAPALFSMDEVRTYFHEFGHALHGLLSNVRHKSQAGTSVPRDFVELPSQIMENWATDPVVMKMYAKHYKTNQVIPDALIDKLELAGTFGQGFETAEFLASALLDMDFHTITSPIATKNAADFEKNSMKKHGLISSIVPRHRATHFGHIFAGGYASGYYSYIWSGVLDTDAFDQFKSTELFNPVKAQSFRKNILEKGGTEDPMKLYIKFRGSEPNNKALLKKRGLDTIN
ncbi:MAG: M3 family metallopeptidase [Cloacibacterium sp.]|nr:M3 family metallopeptidase [Cloacibacterium sp.]